MKPLNPKRSQASLLLVCLATIISLCGCEPNETTTEQATIDPTLIEKRDLAIRQLVAETGSILEPLKELESNEMDAVVALLALSKAVGSYESAQLRRDDETINSYYQELDNVSEHFSRVFDVKTFILNCFDQTVSCLSALKECQDEGRSEEECERSPDAVVACGNEAMCITEQFLKIEKGLPDILGGREPWPPQPKPY